MKTGALLRNVYVVTSLQFLAAVALLQFLRVIFALHNADILGDYGPRELARLSYDGLRFDFCAAAWFNLPFILMRVIPLDFTCRRGYRLVTQLLYGVGNTALLVLQTGDTAYFRFSGARLRWGALTHLWSDPDTGGQLIGLVGPFLWAYLIGGVIVGVVWTIAMVPPGSPPKGWPRRAAWVVASGALLFMCLRGRVTPGGSLEVINAYQHLSDIRQANIVLNTPFCVLRTLADKGEIAPLRFFSDRELAAIRNSEHRPDGTVPAEADARGKNLMVIALESGGSLWSERLAVKPGVKEAGLMPFLDSIAGESLAVRHAIASSVRSVDGLTALFGGFPMPENQVFLKSPYVGRQIDSHVRLLRDAGYSTRFYFGGHRGSYTIDDMLQLMGFESVTNEGELIGTLESDGEWGIYDHEMARFAAADMSGLREPFYTGWFTLNPHPPFNVPDWMAEFGERDPHLRAVRYADESLRRFFEAARQEPWFERTVFIITADHGSRDVAAPGFDGSYVKNHLTFLIYAPDGSIAPGIIEDRVISQTDLGPTLLHITGYDKPYIALGSSLFDPDRADFAPAFGFGMTEGFSRRYGVRLSGDLQQIEAAFDVEADPELTRPLAAPYPAGVDSLAAQVRAYVQDLTVRLTENRLGS